MRRILPLILVLFICNLKAKANCDPAFTATTQGALVHVQAANTDPHLYHSWRTNGSGYFQYGPSATLSFDMPGTFYIVHTVVDSLTHCEDSVSQTVVVDFPVSCSASFTATRDSILWTTYTFRSTSVNTGGTLGYYQWSVDGTFAGFGHTFTSNLYPGVHNVCLYIQTSAGCTSSICRAITVNDHLACNLPSSFTATPSPTNPRQISFAGSPAGDSLTYRWTFGDGYSSTQQNPVHVYNSAGTYNVRFIIRDTINGCFDTSVQNIVVHGLPSDSCTGTFSYSVSGPHHNVVTFAPESNQTIVEQRWVIYNNGPYDSIFLHDGSSPIYTFPNGNYFLVCLFITTNTGCHASDCDSLYIDSLDVSGGRIASYPNPATDKVKLQVLLEQQARITLTVYNIQGTVEYKTEISGHSGSNDITVPVQKLKAGQYLIDIQYGNQRKRSTFLKF